MVKKVSYTVVIEKAAGNYSAYVPDLPGCVATGDSEDEVAQLIREAMAFHLEGIVEDGQAMPRASAVSRQIDTEIDVT